MWRIFTQRRRNKIGRRWIFFALALVLFLAMSRIQVALSPHFPDLGGESSARLMDLISGLPFVFLGLVLFLEAWEALGDYYGPEAGPALHLVPLSRAREFGGRFLSVLFTVLLALALMAGAGQVARVLGMEGLAVPFFPEGTLTLSLTVAALVQAAFTLSLLFLLQTLGRLFMGPWKKRAPSLQFLVDGLVLVPVMAGLTLVAEVLIPRLPVVFFPASFSLHLMGPEAWTPTSRLLWTYARVDPEAAGLFEGGEGLWAIPLALVILATILVFTASAALAEDRIDD
ncbi:MAG: hypothetical protein PT957_00730 [Firmicutes bacterium]|nr:hypothetical protein [Bacillota bacterium]